MYSFSFFLGWGILISTRVVRTYYEDLEVFLGIELEYAESSLSDKPQELCEERSQ